MTAVAAQHKKPVKALRWKTIAQLPLSEGSMPHIGLAGPVTGVVNDFMIVAGGANFPDLPPWEGGQKAFHDKIYVLTKKRSGRYHWHHDSEIRLPFPVAYTANVSFGKSVFILGGENRTGPLKAALRLEWADGHLHFYPLPDLPGPVTAGGAVCLENKIYLAGGNNGKETSGMLFMLDLNHPEAGWQTKAPLPFPVEYAATITGNDGHNDCLYLIGGRYKMAEDSITAFSDKIFKYNPTNDQWTVLDFRLHTGDKIKLAAGASVSIAGRQILLIGGDSGEIFNKIELFNHKIARAKEKERELLIIEKKELLTNHPGFNKAVYLYNPLTNLCTQMGEVPGITQVTTTAFFWKNDIIIPSGEIKPGIRTPQINKVRLIKE